GAAIPGCCFALVVPFNPIDRPVLHQIDFARDSYNLRRDVFGRLVMLTAHRDSIRLLHGILVASVALPAALFVYASWLGYQNNQVIADRQIDRTPDVVTEHALKVFESVERSIAEINEVVRDMPDDRIAANEENLHRRFERLADS